MDNIALKNSKVEQYSDSDETGLENIFQPYVEEFDADFMPIAPHILTGGENPINQQNKYLPGLTPPPLSVHVDYLTVTFSLDTVLSKVQRKSDIGFEITETLKHSQKTAAVHFLNTLEGYVSHLNYHDNHTGRFGYKQSINLFRDEQMSGVFAFDGNSGTAMLSLSGFGCSGVNMHRLGSFLKNLPGAKITRVDLAHDDLNPTKNIHEWNQDARDGIFNPLKGGRPKIRFIDDHGSCDGCTLYVGNKSNGKEACIYEKGKQLGDKESPWVRFEVRFTSVDRIVPFDTLSQPCAYLAASYEPFTCLSAWHERIEIVKKQAKIGFDALTGYARISYGKLINVMIEIGHTPEQIIETLIKPGYPSRLQVPFLE